MPGTAIGKKLNHGYPGSVARNIDCIITNKLSKGIIRFGDPVVLNHDNTYSVFGENDTGEDFVGIAVREVKQAINYNTSVSGYLDKERTDAINRGYVCIKVNNGIPKVNGKVYIRVKRNESIINGVVGGFEAVADADNTVELTNVRFTTGELDANGIAEVTILSRTM
ncbi:hypothetical protein CGQ39_19910 (plasmid) [Clostridium botulinum]|uniref:structural cement protein Gp24 n=1 Tax=Clostridium botulinum TaxID=1491 RepID=UPI0021FDAB89|nr:hypothetical protein [Clostridium botulinum]QDY23180.1 hypothetical protein CGQ39_19910 [Clostridium botulinum]